MVAGVRGKRPARRAGVHPAKVVAARRTKRASGRRERKNRRANASQSAAHPGQTHSMWTTNVTAVIMEAHIPNDQEWPKTGGWFH